MLTASYCPAGQATHETPAVSAWYSPAGHEVHAVEAIVAANDPGSQALQLLSPIPEEVPTLHGTQLDMDGLFW